MDGWRSEGLTEAELCAFFDELFPQGFAGADVFGAVAPNGWEQSPLVACLHPSVERVFEEQVQVHRTIEELGRAGTNRDEAATRSSPCSPEPTLDEGRREYQPTPVKPAEELTELMGQCLWDIFSDNHEVIAADGRVADIGSFRGASAFLDEYASGIRDAWRDGDSMRFYLGTAWSAGRADLMPIYTAIFRRLESAGADWVYHFPELGLVEFAPLGTDSEPPFSHSESESAVGELKAQRHRSDVARIRAELAALNARAREDALDRPTPATVRGYRHVYGRDPRGWPPG